MGNGVSHREGQVAGPAGVVEVEGATEKCCGWRGSVRGVSG